MSKTRSLAIVTAAYVIAVGVAAAWLRWGPSTGRLWLDTFVADVLATVVVFVFSRVYRNSSFYDAYWSVIPPLLLFYWWSQAGQGVDQLRCRLVAIVVLLWAVRLTANWVYAFPDLHHEDWRYPMFKERAGRWEFGADLLAIHLIPTCQVFLGMVPVYVAVTRPGVGLAWLSWAAFAIGIGAVALALFGIAAAPADAWWLVIGAVAILAMFLGASIPMMETRSLERRPAYRDVVERVSRFVPWPPKAVS
ncbi:MAG: hypothetical protein QOJ80_1657 [Mycobacterium sp.]|jgi:steroid 5-alpha reductase family enzyme|nr:hypothetical protein [Mycobacterium sp.]